MCDTFLLKTKLKSPKIFYSIQDKYPKRNTNHCPFCNNPDVKYHIHNDSVSPQCNNCRNYEDIDLDDAEGLERMFLRWSK